MSSRTATKWKSCLPSWLSATNSRSVAITTNLVFSEWDQIFKNPMTTMAALDRVVHHSVILDMMGLESFRARAAQQRQQPTEGGDPAD